MTNNYIILDVETGGKFPTKDATTGEHNGITQLALRVIDPIKFKLLHSYNAFVKPYDNTTINKAALDYTRVSMKDINNGLDVNVFTKQLVDCFKIANKSGKKVSAPILVGHNIEFDTSFLEYIFARKNKSLYDFVQHFCWDTLWLCRAAEAGQLRSDDVNRYTLTACCERFGIPLKNAHNAVGDTQVTEMLFMQLLKRLRLTGGGSNQPVEQETKPSKSRDNFHFEF